MRILFVHNKYGALSGEERMIERIIFLLRDNGHDVRTFYKESSSIQSTLGQTQAFFSGVWSRSAAQEFFQILDDYSPDIVQIQNLYPLVSPSILSVCKQASVPVVMRLSNYRLFCPNGLLMTKGEVCEKCRGGKEYWCVLRNCEGSAPKSIGYAIRGAVARKFKLFSKGVTRFYAQTEFQRGLHVSEGFSSETMDVIPNFLTLDELVSNDNELALGKYVGFSGRLSPEKGVDLLLSAAKKLPTVPFRFAGRPGTYADMNLPKNVELCGELHGAQLAEFYRNSRIIVLPSIWYEGFPGVALDAMKFRKPIIASNIGGIPEIVEHGTTGLLCRPSDVDDFAKSIEKLWTNHDLATSLGEGGRTKLASEYTPGRYYTRLMQVYVNAIKSNRENLQLRV